MKEHPVEMQIRAAVLCSRRG